MTIIHIHIIKYYFKISFKGQHKIINAYTITHLTFLLFGGI